MKEKNSYKYANTNFVGKRFGRLVVIDKSKNGRSRWICKCDCGNTVELVTYRLLEYNSCGCLEKENKKNLTKYTKTHGMTKTRLYHVWSNIKDRCYNPGYKYYYRYGGRGISVCDDWKNSFESFQKWAISSGYSDSLNGGEQSLDRINVDGDYEPNNCRWVNQKQQMRNISRNVNIIYNGKTITISELCEINGITYNSFAKRRLDKGVLPERIVEEWNIKSCKSNHYMDIDEAAKHYSVCVESIYNWIKNGIITADKIGNKWYIPKGQIVHPKEGRDKLGRFLHGYKA